jgi:hypothetical protein
MVLKSFQEIKKETKENFNGLYLEIEGVDPETKT